MDLCRQWRVAGLPAGKTGWQMCRLRVEMPAQVVRTTELAQ